MNKAGQQLEREAVHLQQCCLGDGHAGRLRAIRAPSLLRDVALRPARRTITVPSYRRFTAISFLGSLALNSSAASSIAAFGVERFDGADSFCL
jgi:hypothetical protein